MTASAEAHVKTIGAHLGRPLSIGAEGTLELRFEDGAAVTLEMTGEESLYLYSVMGPAPVDANALRALLETHFFGRIEGRIRFAIDPGSGELLLIESVDLAKLPPHEMPLVFEAFLAEARRQQSAQVWMTAAPVAGAEVAARAGETAQAGHTARPIVHSAADPADLSSSRFPAMRV